MSLTDAELIFRSVRGDATAFQELYERHWKPVYRFAWLLSGSVADAEDITQECFLALIRCTAVFDPARAQLRTWLIAVARRQFLNRLREQELACGNEVDIMTPIDEELIRVECADAVRRAVAALPLAQREALYLFEFEGLSLAEVAAALGIEPNAVKARLFRAREQLKRLLAPLRKGVGDAR